MSPYRGVNGARYREDDEGYAQEEAAERQLRNAYYRQSGQKLIEDARREAKRLADAKAERGVQA